VRPADRSGRHRCPEVVDALASQIVPLRLRVDRHPSRQRERTDVDQAGVRFTIVEGLVMRQIRS
jgi:hypothetical protein